MLYLAWDREINISLFFATFFSWKWDLKPRTSSRCYHSNKSAATFKKGIFVHPPKWCCTDCAVVESWKVIIKSVAAETGFPRIYTIKKKWRRRRVGLSDRSRIFEKNIPGNDEMINLIFDGLSYITRRNFALNRVGYSYSPWHDCPSPVYPSLQVQIWEPFVLLQFELTSQTWLPLLHSLASVNKN